MVEKICIRLDFLLVTFRILTSCETPQNAQAKGHLFAKVTYVTLNK